MQKSKRSTINCKVKKLGNQRLRLLHLVTRGGSTICLITISMRRLVHLKKIWKVHQQLALTCRLSSLALPRPVNRSICLSRLNFKSQILSINQVMSNRKFLLWMKSKHLLVKTTVFTHFKHNKFLKGKV